MYPSGSVRQSQWVKRHRDGDENSNDGRKIRKEDTPKEQWVSIWNIFFESESQLKSVYVDTEVTQEVPEVREPFRKIGDSILVRERQSANLWNQPENARSENTRRSFTELFPAASAIPLRTAGSTDGTTSFTIADSGYASGCITKQQVHGLQAPTLPQQEEAFEVHQLRILQDSLWEAEHQTDTLREPPLPCWEESYDSQLGALQESFRKFTAEIASEIHVHLGPHLQNAAFSEALPIIFGQFAHRLGTESFPAVEFGPGEKVKLAIRAKSLGYVQIDQQKQKGLLVLQDIMKLIEKHIYQLCQDIRSLVADSQSGCGAMPLQDKMSLWSSKASSERETNYALFGELCKDSISPSWIGTQVLPFYKEVILQSLAFQWLILCLFMERGSQWNTRLTADEVSNSADEIRQVLLQQQISAGWMTRWSSSEKRRVEFCFSAWHVLQDLHSDDNTMGKTLSLGILDSKVVVGRSENAQATSVREYVSRTWPSTWRHIYYLLQRVLQGTDDEKYHGIAFCPKHHDQRFITDLHKAWLSNKAEMIAKKQQGSLVVAIDGDPSLIAECGEQLAWIRSAITEKVPTSIVSVRPVISETQLQTTTLEALSSQSMRFEIDAQRIKVESILNHESDWGHILGEDFVAIQGYPIAKRPGGVMGLEVSYHMLLKITGSPARTTFTGGRVEIFGPLKTFELTDETAGFFFWHAVHPGNSECTRDKSVGYQFAEGGPDASEIIGGRHIITKCLESTALGLKNRDGEIPENITESSAIVQNTAKFSYTLRIDDSQALRLTQSDETILPTTEDASPIPSIKKYWASDPLSPGQSTSDRSEFCRRYWSDSSSLADSDMLSISEGSEDVELISDDDPTMPVIRDLARHLVAKFRCAAGGEACLKGEADNRATSADHREPSFSTPLPSSSRLSGSYRKRKRGDDDDPKKEQYATSSSGPAHNSRRRFACPFWKHAPGRYRDCFVHKLNRIQDVKQHLSRRHTPEHYCGRCSTIFRDKQSYLDHISNPEGLFCTPSTNLDGISTDQRQKLCRKSNPKLSPEEKWFAIWEVLFPTRPRPSSVYRDEGIPEDWVLFKDFCQRNADTILAERTFQVPREPHQTALSREDAQRHLRRIIIEGVHILVEQYLSIHHSDSDVTQSTPSSFQSSNSLSIPSETPPGSNADSGIVVSQQTCSVESHSDLLEVPGALVGGATPLTPVENTFNAGIYSPAIITNGSRGIQQVSHEMDTNVSLQALFNSLSETDTRQIDSLQDLDYNLLEQNSLINGIDQNTIFSLDSSENYGNFNVGVLFDDEETAIADPGKR